MTKFEKDFPSLQKEEYKWKACVGQPKRPEAALCSKCNTNPTMSFEFVKILLEKYCIDKAKVKEVIDKLGKYQIYQGKKPIAGKYAQWYIRIKELKKELGLE